MTHRGRLPFHPAHELPSCPPSPHRWQASSSITLPPPVSSPRCSELCACRQKGTWESCGRPARCGLRRKWWAGTSSRESHWFHWALLRSWTFLFGLKSTLCDFYWYFKHFFRWILAINSFFNDSWVFLTDPQFGVTRERARPDSDNLSGDYQSRPHLSQEMVPTVT